MLQVLCSKAAWLPSGAAGLPKALPLLHTPAVPTNCQGEPLGAYWNVLAASDGTSKLPSLMLVALSSSRLSRCSNFSWRRGWRRAARREFVVKAPNSLRPIERNIAIAPAKGSCCR